VEINSKTLVTIGTIVGIMAGSFGMWFTLKDRMEKQIETRVVRDINIETRIARLEERFESLRSEVWTQRANTEKK
jgi:hypothetical protein